MSFRPMFDRILVKRLDGEEKTAGGLFIPDTAKEKASRAKVIAVGSGKLLKNGTLRPNELKVGDVVVLGPYHYSDIKVDGEDVVIMKEGDVLAVES
jgi:chaperonin GroES